MTLVLRSLLNHIRKFLNSEKYVSSNQTIVVGGVPEHFNLPWHLCLESNQFKDAGLDVKYVDIPGGTGAMTSGLAEKELDVAIVLAEGGIASVLKGNPCSVVKTYVESPLIWGIHVAAHSDIETIEQIQGKRYAISRFGSGSHLMAIVDAAERGWPTEDLKFKKIGNLDGARKALADGCADIFFWERFTTAPFVESGEFRRVGERRTLWPAFLILVRDEILEARSSDIRKVLEIINVAVASLMSSPDACELISSRYKLKLDQVEQWFAQTKWNTNFEQPVQAIETVLKYLQKLDIVTPQQAASRDVWHAL